MYTFGLHLIMKGGWFKGDYCWYDRWLVVFMSVSGWHDGSNYGCSHRPGHLIISPSRVYSMWVLPWCEIPQCHRFADKPNCAPSWWPNEAVFFASTLCACMHVCRLWVNMHACIYPSIHLCSHQSFSHGFWSVTLKVFALSTSIMLHKLMYHRRRNLLICKSPSRISR